MHANSFMNAHVAPFEPRDQYHGQPSMPTVSCECPSLWQDLWRQLKRVQISVFSGDKRTNQSWKAASLVHQQRASYWGIQLATTATILSGGSSQDDRNPWTFRSSIWGRQRTAGKKIWRYTSPNSHLYIGIRELPTNSKRKCQRSWTIRWSAGYSNHKSERNISAAWAR